MHSKFANGAVVVVVIAALAFGIAAVLFDWEPAHTMIRLQEAWNDGSYYMKLTVLATLMFVAIPVPFVAALLVLLIDGFRSRSTPPVDWASTWAVVDHRSRPWLLPLAVVGTILGGAFVFEFVAHPEALEGIPLSWLLGSPMLLAAPAILVVSSTVVLDALLPARWHWGPITRLIEQTSNRGSSMQYLLVSGGRSWSIPQTTFLKLSVGQEVAIRYGALSLGVRELRLRSTPPRVEMR